MKKTAGKTREEKRNEKKKRGYFSMQYSLCWSYIKESKNFIWIILLVLLFSVLLGFVYQPLWVVDIIREYIENLLMKTQGLNFWQMIIFILNNNLKVSFFSMVAGIFLGIFPLAATFSNGYVLGFVAEKAVVAEGAFSLLRLFPHGIFEFPALILSLALGVKFGFFFTAKKGKRAKELKRRLEESLRVFLFVILPLLIVAAIIEGALIIVLG